MQLDLRPSGTLRIGDLLDRGELDLAVGNFADPGERFGLMPLLDDRFVLAMRRDHPAEPGALTADAIAGLGYLEISSSHEDTSFIDDWLGQHGLERRIAHRAPYLSMARILSQSDLAAILCRRIAEAYMRVDKLQFRELPCPSPRVAIGMLWHRRLENQPAHKWLRELVEAVCKRL